MRRLDILFIVSILLMTVPAAYFITKYAEQKRLSREQADKDYEQAWKDIHISADSLLILLKELKKTERENLESLKKLNNSLKELDIELEKLEKTLK